MKNCGICNIALSFGNTPVLGAGKIMTGEILCLNCFRKVIKIDAGMNVKKHTLDQIKELLQEKEQKNSIVEDQLKELGISKQSRYWGRREISELESILISDEKLFALTQGTYNNGNGILVGTNKRLIFIDKGLIFGLKIEDFGLDKITSIQYESGLLLASIKILASGNIAKIENVDKAEAKDFCEKARIKLSEIKNSEPIQIIQNNQIDVADQLLKLSKLKEQGILTEDEFLQQKNKLLNL